MLRAYAVRRCSPENNSTQSMQMGSRYFHGKAVNALIDFCVVCDDWGGPCTQILFLLLKFI